jgi:hypothetical protein
MREFRSQSSKFSQKNNSSVRQPNISMVEIMKDDLIQVKAEIMRERAIGDDLQAEVDRLRTLINLMDEQQTQHSPRSKTKSNPKLKRDELVEPSSAVKKSKVSQQKVMSNNEDEETIFPHSLSFKEKWKGKK